MIMRFCFSLALAALCGAQTLPPPGFHHLHLNSVDPDAAIEFYTRGFPSTARGTYAGGPALKSGPVWVLFTKVKMPPSTQPQTAIWHFGWHCRRPQEHGPVPATRRKAAAPLYNGRRWIGVRQQRHLARGQWVTGPHQDGNRRSDRFFWSIKSIVFNDGI